ncbi:C-type lectin domain family 11 member A [Spea bombifrons]|uniref:C-type lectin domain family 11 member A n=1 Tax=Spea bombifrons TaxID=233779 RepID=UPI00234B1F53|nr:C-type lectin domain family 11 member A [Spea bombifrons]
MFLARVFLVLFCMSQIPNSLSEEKENEEKAGEVTSQEIHGDLETEDTDFEKMFLGPLPPPKTRTPLTLNVTVISVKRNREEMKEEEKEEDDEDEDMIDQEENVLEETIPTKAVPTTAAPEDDNLSYVLSRISALESAIHRLNVQFYGMDVKMTQMSQSLSKMRTKLSEAEETVTTVSEMNMRNQKQIGQIEGCLKGKRFTRKCYLIFQHFETHAAAQQLCHDRGGNLAMPIDQQEYTALAQYVHDAFYPFNWPIWIGINDLRSEGMYLYENGHRVSFFNWYKDHLVTQPNGGTQENCVSITSHDGKWWDNDCSRRMYYVCEY